MKHASRLSRAAAALSALVILLGLAARAQAQTISPTPDSFVLQITSTTIPPLPPATPTPTPSASPSPTPVPGPVARHSFASGISGDGRFVVIESSGDIATNRTPERNNADGNPEIFLFDYAQRRVYQITNTKNALKNNALSPVEPSNIEVQVINVRPSISHDGRFVVFVSNAYADSDASTSPKNFDGNGFVTALKADGNSEIFLYAVPAVAAADLSSGVEVAPTDLSTGTMTRVTNTPATALPRAGAIGLAPFFARDNDAPAVNDDASIIAFHSQARAGIPGIQNTDGNQEIFLFNRAGAGSYVQVTNTADKPSAGNPIPILVYNNNPSLSATGTVLAFESNADINSAEPAADHDNGEIYAASFDGATVSNLRPLTRTPPERRAVALGRSVNILSPGQRLSRDGTRLAFETSAVFNADGTLNGGLGNTYGLYVITIGATSNTFAQIMSRAPETEDPDLERRFPTFTGDSTRVVWMSDLNVRADGTVALDGATDGLNQERVTQVFSAPVAAVGTSNQQISRLTRQPTRFVNIQPVVSDTVRRFAFSLNLTELGGGNSDGLFEAFYAFIPEVLSETPAPSPTPATSPAPVTFSTGASDRPVVAATPAPTPPAVTGLAPGMLGIARSTISLAPSDREVDRNNAHETLRRPPLPVELNGVSVSISNAAAGLYFVSPGQINFVVPPGLIPATTPLPVVINNNGAVIRTSLQVNAAQPDIFTSTNGPGGRAAVLNVTNPCVSPSGEPFPVTTTRPLGSGATGVCTSAETETAPTRLLILLTGIRALPSTATITVRIGTTDITGSAIAFFGPSLTPGFEQIVVDLPASLAGAGDVPLIVTVTTAAGTFTSRPADTAPRITIQ